MKPEKPELLAPAGSTEALIAAVENGADAVYLGARAFSARGYASNFTEKELEEAVDYAHLRGVKVYVTVNTLLKEREIKDALDLLSHLREIGADAIIIQDLGLISLARKYLPDLPLHASTQMTLHNKEGVEFVKNLGIKRVVLSRETSLEEIKQIKENVDSELEVFIHGALCISYSGQCLLSSLIGGRSGNRGYCAQPCRKKYRLFCAGKQVKTRGDYLLSPRDLNIASGLGALIEAGIESFKIEGRMKRPEYVAGVVRIYRRLIDRYFENPAGYFVSEEEQEILAQLFNRGFTQGYFFEKSCSELMSQENPHNRGMPSGTVLGYDRRLKHIRIKLFHPLRLGDGIMVENAETNPEDKGKIISAMYTEQGPVYSADRGAVVEIPFEAKAPPKSAVYKTHDKKLMDTLKKESESGNLRSKIPVTINANVEQGKPLVLEIRDKDSNTVKIESEYLVEKAERQPALKEQIEKQLSKLGNTLFEAVEIHINMGEGVFVPVGQLNDIRTKAIWQLEQLRVSKWKRESLKKLNKDFDTPEFSASGKKGRKRISGRSEKEASLQKPLLRPLLSVSVYSFKGLLQALEGGADCVYFGEGLYRNQESAEKKGTEGEELKHPLSHIFEKAVIKAREEGKKIYFITPKVVKGPELKEVEKIFSYARNFGADGILVSNLGVLNLAKSEKISCIVDSPLNVYNSHAFSLLLEHSAQRVTISPELTLKEIKDIALQGTAECIVHGRLELMESEYCLIGGLLGKRNEKGICNSPCRSGNLTLVDEKNYVFPLIMDYKCRMHLLNSKALCMLEYIPEFLKNGVSSFRLETLGIGNPEEIGKITRAYRKAIDTYSKTGKAGTEKCESLGKDFTKGHYFRGVQ
jgi:putative protease